MANLLKDEEYVLNCMRYALFDNFDISSGIVSGVRFVNSIEEAKTLAGGESFNRKYNKFELFFFCCDKYFTALEFSIYIDLNLDKIYISFDDIPNKELRLKDKPFPKLYGILNFKSLEQDLEHFADEVLTPALFDYYKGSEYTPEGNAIHILYPINGVFVGIKEFISGVINLKPIRSIINMQELLSKKLTEDISQAYRTESLQFQDTFYVAESITGDFHYIFANGFLWYNSPLLSLYQLESSSNLSLLRLEA